MIYVVLRDSQVFIVTTNRGRAYEEAKSVLRLNPDLEIVYIEVWLNELCVDADCVYQNH